MSRSPGTRLPEPAGRDLPDLPVDPLGALRQRRSAKWRTYPADVLPLTVAEMDFALAGPVAAALREAVGRSDAGYAMAMPDLGDALAGFASRRWNWNPDPAAVTAVTDVGVGVVELLRVLARPGDAVVISPPVYPPFFDWVAEAGARLVEVPLARGPAGWRLDLPALEQAFAARPAAYVLCNPHNPVGRVHDAAELAALVRLAQTYQVAVISDEIHGPLVLPGARFTPLLTVPGAAEVAISVLSASKAWNLAGLKCAAVVTAAPRMAAVIDRFPADSRWRIGHFGVIAAVAAFTAGEPWLDQLLATLDAPPCPARGPASPASSHAYLAPAGGHLPRLAQLLGPRPGRPGPRPVPDPGARRTRARPAVRRRRQRLRPAELRHKHQHSGPGHRADGTLRYLTPKSRLTTLIAEPARSAASWLGPMNPPK